MSYLYTYVYKKSFANMQYTYCKESLQASNKDSKKSFLNILCKKYIQYVIVNTLEDHHIIMNVFRI